MESNGPYPVHCESCDRETIHLSVTFPILAQLAAPSSSSLLHGLMPPLFPPSRCRRLISGPRWDSLALCPRCRMRRRVITDLL